MSTNSKIEWTHLHLITNPGEMDGWAHHGKRYLIGHKAIWLWSRFEDLRERSNVVEQIEASERERK